MAFPIKKVSLVFIIVMVLGLALWQSDALPLNLSSQISMPDEKDFPTLHNSQEPSHNTSIVRKLVTIKSLLTQLDNLKRTAIESLKEKT